MAKKPFRKRGKYLRGRVEEELLLSTLAGKTVLGENFDSVVGERTWLSSVRATWSLGNLTDAFSEGPITVGLAHSDYTDAEIEEFLEVTGSWDEGNLGHQEQASRRVRVVGTFPSSDQALGVTTLNDGKPITTKCGFMLLTGQTAQFWAYNSGSNALTVTSAELTVVGHANLWPK